MNGAAGHCFRLALQERPPTNPIVRRLLRGVPFASRTKRAAARTYIKKFQESILKGLCFAQTEFRMKMTMLNRRFLLFAMLAAALGAPATAFAQDTAPAPITSQDLLGGLKNPTRWLTFSGDYNGQRHSPLKQLTPQNVSGLVPQWVFQTDLPGMAGRGIENTPLVVDGILYVTGNYDEAWALDGKTGRPIWSYRKRLSHSSHKLSDTSLVSNL